MSPLTPSNPVREESVPGGRAWSVILKRGFGLKLTDSDGGANCSALFFNAADKLERYNMPDTLKAQHTAHLTAGHVCYSDMGRILVAITEDTSGWHDPFCGVSDDALVTARYGAARYQEYRNACHRSGRELFLVELGKWGLGLPDLLPGVNFFSKVTADETGRLKFDTGHAKAGAHVWLRAEMDVLVVLNTAPHPFDPAPAWAPKPVLCSIARVPQVHPDDACFRHCPENQRGYANNALYHCQD
jgi:hypothetical protein